MAEARLNGCMVESKRVSLPDEVVGGDSEQVSELDYSLNG